MSAGRAAGTGRTRTCYCSLRVGFPIPGKNIYLQLPWGLFHLTQAVVTYLRQQRLSSSVSFGRESRQGAGQRGALGWGRWKVFKGPAGKSDV